MPRLNGYELVRKIRETDSEVIIIMESGKTSPKDVLSGFESGIDAYLKKPFIAEELHANVQTLLKRIGKLPASENKGKKDTGNYRHIGLYGFDVQNKTLEFQSNSMKLTKREADILKILCDHKNNVVSRNKILVSLWGADNYFNSRSLDVFISKLRKYLSGDSSVEVIVLRSEGGIQLEC